jgi:hypothetical protein
LQCFPSSIAPHINHPSLPLWQRQWWNKFLRII